MSKARMKTARLAAGVCVSAMLITAFPVATASAAVTHRIEVGMKFPRSSGVPGYSSRFYPSWIEIHSGDTIKFLGAPGFLLPVGTSPQEFRADNLIAIGQPYFFFLKDRDEGRSALKVNTPALEPTDPDCGSADQPPCVFDGHDGTLASGDRATEFNVTITSAPGETVWVAAGFGTQSMRIDIVDNTQPASSRDELDARAERLKRQDLETARVAHAHYSKARTSSRTADGARVFDAYAGVDMGPVSLNAFYPRTLRIRRRDTVRWHFHLENEIHSAVFPVSTARRIFDNNFVALCDPDGDRGSSPDVPPDTKPGDGFCTDPAHFELDMDPRERAAPRGNGRFSGSKDFEHSGLRLAESGSPGFGNEASWDVRFGARSPDRGWRYLCTIHGRAMAGTVVVR